MCEIAGEAAIAFAVVEAIVARDDPAIWRSDGGFDAVEVGLAGISDELAKGRITQGEVLSAVVDAAVMPAFGRATSAKAA